MDELKFFRMALSPLEVDDLHQASMEAVFASAKSGNADATARVREHFLKRVDETAAKAREAVVAARKSLEDDVCVMDVQSLYRTLVSVRTFLFETTWRA